MAVVGNMDGPVWEMSAAAKNDSREEMEVVLGQLERELDRLRPVYESVQVSSTSPSLSQ